VLQRGMMKRPQVVLLVFSFPNDAEKRGYHDF
jgi:hypothetical protein